ncbi:hypothetical protein DF200_02550 [Bifidobacterium catulorum]|uniref:Uncharacterized protein n=1 Tax=Bifidobacterium catulorum TaxID=1630173 RepID=A0A2U2MUQ4_9BIFI|nr:hypothetical protein DF200_02550 [Bifidobacterium catulorum]
MPLIIRAKEWNHILYGSNDGGGHLHGYGWQNPGKAIEFPEHWTSDDIRDAGIAILDSEENRATIARILADGKRRGVVSGTIDGIEIKVAFSQAGKGPARVTSMFPVGKE